MTTRPLILLPLLFTGLYTMAQEDTLDTRIVPYIDHEPAAIDATPLEPDSTRVLMLVEVMPEFPGGMTALSEFVSRELRYPKEARKKGVEGRVVVTFVVEKDGTISNARVLRGIGSGCDEEAVRVVQQMPTWKPGQQGGKPVRVQFNLPIRFKLED